MKKYSLTRIFTIFSIIAFIATGTILAIFISGHIRDYLTTSLTDTTISTATSIVWSNLKADDFAGEISSIHGEKVKEQIFNALNFYEPKSISILNNRREVILSTDPGLEYGTVTDDTAIDNVITSKTGISANVSIADGAGVEPILRIYIPIISNNTTIGVLLIDFPDKVISEHVVMLNRIIVTTLIGGLLLLFLLLNRVISNASKTLTTQNVELTEKKKALELSYGKLRDSYINTVIALSNAVDARDQYTAGHSARVTKIARLLGRALELSDNELSDLEYAAMFHDIGKLGVPDQILLKSSKLTDEEYSLIKKHPDIGIGILEEIGFLKEAIPIIRHHHERFSGNGYPDGLKGEQIPLGARIIAIADAYDAMTSDRPYRKGISHDAAVREIFKNRNIQFDGMIVDIFMTLDQNEVCSE